MNIIKLAKLIDLYYNLATYSSLESFGGYSKEEIDELIKFPGFADPYLESGRIKSQRYREKLKQRGTYEDYVRSHNNARLKVLEEFRNNPASLEGRMTFLGRRIAERKHQYKRSINEIKSQMERHNNGEKKEILQKKLNALNILHADFESIIPFF